MVHEGAVLPILFTLLANNGILDKAWRRVALSVYGQ